VPTTSGLLTKSQKNNGNSLATEMTKNIIGIPRISVEFKAILNLQLLFERKNLVDSVKSESLLVRKEPDSHYIDDHHFACLSLGKMSKSLQNRSTVAEHKGCILAFVLRRQYRIPPDNLKLIVYFMTTSALLTPCHQLNTT